MDNVICLANMFGSTHHGDDKKETVLNVLPDCDKTDE